MKMTMTLKKVHDAALQALNTAMEWYENKVES